jgi:hypothetical protein
VPTGGPDCRWTITIDDARAPVEDHPWLGAMQASALAALPNEPRPNDEPGGRDDYAGAFDPGFALESLSHRALQVVCREFAFQGHLIARAMMTALDRAFSPEEATAAGIALFAGTAWVAAERVARAFSLDTATSQGLAQAIALTHLVCLDDYAGFSLEVDGDAVRIALRADAVGLRETDGYSLPGLVRDGADVIVEALVHGADRAAIVEAAAAHEGELRAWRATPSSGPEVDEPGYVRVMRFSTGPSTVLFRRAPLAR